MLFWLNRLRMEQYTQLHVLASNIKNYAITELEALGIVWAIKHFHHYLYGHYCKDYIDHEPLMALLNSPHP